MVRVLVVEPDESWQAILKHNIGRIVTPEYVDVRSDYHTVDSLLGLTQNCASRARYDYYVINTNIPTGIGETVTRMLGIDLAQKIVEITEQESRLIHITSGDIFALEEAKRKGFSNLYLRNHTGTSRYPNELFLYSSLRACINSAERERAS